MTLPTLGIDAYQLTTLLTHADEGRLDHEVTMSFFFRRMPKDRYSTLTYSKAVERACDKAFPPPEPQCLSMHRQ